MEKLFKSEIGSNPSSYLDQLIEHYADGKANKPFRLVPEITVTQTPVVNEAVAEIEAEIEAVSHGNQMLKMIVGYACHEHPDPDIFFPYKKMKGYRDTVDEAKQVCSSCIDKIKCLDGALEREEPFGIWGEMTEDERQEILKRKARRQAI